MDVGKVTGPAEGPARCEETAHHAEAAGAEPELSERWIRELLLWVQKRGDEGLRHGLRERASNRKTSEGVKRRVVELFWNKQGKLWHDYGPTLACAELAYCWSDGWTEADGCAGEGRSWAWKHPSVGLKGRVSLLARLEQH